MGLYGGGGGGWRGWLQTEEALTRPGQNGVYWIEHSSIRHRCKGGITCWLLVTVMGWPTRFPGLSSYPSVNHIPRIRLHFHSEAAAVTRFHSSCHSGSLIYGTMIAPNNWAKSNRTLLEKLRVVHLNSVRVIVSDCSVPSSQQPIKVIYPVQDKAIYEFSLFIEDTLCYHYSHSVQIASVLHSQPITFSTVLSF